MREDDGDGSDPRTDPPAETADAVEDRPATDADGGVAPGPDPSGDTAESGVPAWTLYVWDLVSSVAIVVVIGGLLFTASGIWPPMVAVESGSMQPVMERGDLVYVMEGDRFPGEGAHEPTGIVTAESGRETDYEKFGAFGDVIVYQPNGDDRQTPIIHRAMFWVEAGEDWSDRADPAYLNGDSVCREGASGDRIPNCPAPHAGFITKGDDNGAYDQVVGIARGGPVKPAWVVGTAEVLVPYLGQIRLGSVGATNGTATNDSVPTVSTPAP